MHTELSKAKVMIDYVYSVLKNKPVISKGSIEIGTESFKGYINSSSRWDDKKIKKGINLLYSKSEKCILTHTKLLDTAFSNTVDSGAVFYVDEGDLGIDDLCDIPLYLSTYSTLMGIDSSENYNFNLSNYMVLHKLKDDIMGVLRFAHNNIQYLYCFSINIESSANVTLLLVGDDVAKGTLGLNKLLCDRVLLCGGSTTVQCKKIFKEDIDCVHKKFLTVLNFSINRVMSLCLVDGVKENIEISIKESIVLRDNAKIVNGDVYVLPTVVLGKEGEVLIQSDNKSILQYARS